MRATIAAIVLVTFGLAAMLLRGQEPPESEVTAETWIGAIVDWDCKQRSERDPCGVGPGTKRYGMSIDGGFLLEFDERGQELAREALAKARAGGNARIRAVGEREGRLLKAESVEVVRR